MLDGRKFLAMYWLIYLTWVIVHLHQLVLLMVSKQIYIAKFKFMEMVSSHTAALAMERELMAGN